jgi:hypothetical protein
MAIALLTSRGVTFVPRIMLWRSILHTTFVEGKALPSMRSRAFLADSASCRVKSYTIPWNLADKGIAVRLMSSVVLRSLANDDSDSDDEGSTTDDIRMHRIESIRRSVAQAPPARVDK